MTLKEQTIKRIENQKEKMEADNQTFGRTSVFDRLELDYLENLLKALEVLEILKKHLFKGCYETDDGETYDMICLLALTTQMDEKQDYDKIKEWLENDR